MLRQSHHLHLESLRLAAKNAGTAAEAFLCINDRLELLAALCLCHLYCIETAAVNAILATIAILEFNAGEVSALLPGQADRKSSLG